MTIAWNYILRLFIAGLLGGLIGLERELRAKGVGVRTHFIVALGSALFMLISQYAFSGQFDHARVAAQVVSGIGFIGAGVIIFQQNVVKGITTAAGLWVAAAIGLAGGAGMFDVAVASTIMTIVCLETMHLITRRVGERIVRVKVHDMQREEILSMMEIFKKSNLEVDSLEVSEGSVIFQIKTRQKDYIPVVEYILTATKGHKTDIV